MCARARDRSTFVPVEMFPTVCLTSVYCFVLFVLLHIIIILCVSYCINVSLICL